MRQRRFGRLGWQVSEVGYGMWGMGGWTGSDDDESLAALERAVDLGCNFFDTAWVYGQGHSEKLLGQLLRKRGRDSFFLATKVPPKNMRWPGKAETPIAGLGFTLIHEHLLLDLSRGRAFEEPADKGDPQATAKISREHLRHAPENKDKGDRAARSPGDQRRPTKITGGRPEDGAEDSASVQGEAGDEIKQRQRSVDVGEILGEGKQRSDTSQKVLQETEDRGKGEAHRGSREGDPKLGAAAGSLTTDLRNAAKEENHDAADRDAVMKRHDRVA